MKHTATPPTCRPPVISAGFTLVELLTTIAIIAILAGITIPAVSRVRQSAKQTTCINRLRGLGPAFQLYINEHRGRFPNPRNSEGNRWPFYIAPYIGPWLPRYDDNGRVKGLADTGAEFYRNPLIHDPANEIDPASEARGTFAYNVELEEGFGVNAGRYVSYSALSAPSSFPVLATSQGDVGGGLRLTWNGPSPKALEHGYTGAVESTGPAPNYGRRAVFLFADWHVSARDVCDPNAWPWTPPGAHLVQ